MKYKSNWEETKEKFTNYWQHKNTGRPLMCVVARKEEIEHLPAEKTADGDWMGQICQGDYYGLQEELKWKDMEDKYQNAERMIARYHQFCETHEFLGESFPNLNVDFGPGSLAAYLGSDIVFEEQTVWFKEFLDSWENYPELKFDPDNKWFQKHVQLIERCREIAGDDFCVDMPDLLENFDTIAAMRGVMDTLYDMMDEPEEIASRISQITKIYFDYFDTFYNIIKDKDGGHAYTVFQIWGPGKTSKLCCDFSAMISPDQFREFVVPSLREQSSKLDYVLYHLDGKDAIKHVDALMEIEGIHALQWTSGDFGPDGTLPDWDVIYDKVIAAGKSLWIKVYSGEFEDWIKNVDRIVKKYGSHSLFIHFPEMSLQQANYLLDYADKNWSDIKGTFCEELGK